MGPIRVSIKGYDDQGYENVFSIELPDFDEEGTKTYRLLQSYAGLAGLTAARAGATVSDTNSAVSELGCQFCGSEVKMIEKFGNMKRDMSAQEVASSRAEKMGKMGKIAKPVCSKCWKQGGHASAWEEYYKNTKR